MLRPARSRSTFAGLRDASHVAAIIIQLLFLKIKEKIFFSARIFQAQSSQHIFCLIV